MALLGLLGEAAIGVLVEELLKKVPEVGRRVTKFKDAAERLEETLRYISPLIQDIEHHSHALERRPEVLQILANFRKSLAEGQEFVNKCLKVGRWELWKKIYRKKGLDKLDNSLRRFEKHMLLLMARDAGETLWVVKRIHLSLPDYTQLTVSIIENGSFRQLAVEIHDPTYTPVTESINPSGHLRTGWCDKVQFENCMGQTQITWDEELIIIRRNCYSGESNGYKIATNSGMFDGYTIADSSAATFPCLLLKRAANQKHRRYGYFSLRMLFKRDAIHRRYDYFTRHENNGSIRQLILYDGPVWGRNLQEQSIPMSSATVRLGRRGLRSSLPWIPSYTIPPWTSSLREVASHDNSCAPMEIETSAEVASHRNSYVPMENETSGVRAIASHDNSYVTMENETNVAGEVVSHDGSINSDSRKKENDDTEDISRKCLKEQLHVLQGTVNGQKLLIATSVMVCFLSLIMNFVILMYK